MNTNVHPPASRAERLGPPHPSGQRPRPRSRPDQRDHAGDGLHDRLGHLHCLRRNFPRSRVARAAHCRLDRHRLPHHCRRAHLRRTRRHDAARRRPVRLSARIARPALGISLRLDPLSRDSNRHHRRRRRSLRQVPRGFLAGHLLHSLDPPLLEGADVRDRPA